ncbi:flavodoxin family protein [Vallitalea okinawensis]|uniref:flavodoxin family protein n=1 Tax=Vallitalea okinawensis TaxID=2078660 RepID=UPI00130054A8|nr:flavodoxin family protein [Vallitalea okinawensis]
MNILLISGSPRKKGNTEMLLEFCSQEVEIRGIKTDLVCLSDKIIHHCKGCNKCRDRDNCILQDDFNRLYRQVLDYDGLVIGTPVYVGMPTSLIMAFIQRLTMVAFNNGRSLSGKFGGGFAIGGEAGQLAAITDLIKFFLVNNMVVIGSDYWNIGFATKKGDIMENDKSLKYIENFAENLLNHVKLMEG